MKKRLFSKALAFVLALSLLCCSAPMVGAATRLAFNDIPQTAWYAGQVYALVNAGILNGTDKNLFSPGDVVTRSQFLQMLAASVLSKDELAEFGGEVGFEDVPETKWYAPAVSWGVANGITQGVSETRFAPEQAVTREEAAVFLVRFAGKYLWQEEQPAETEPVTFADEEKISDWAVQGVSTCQQVGVLLGYPDGTFRPQARTLRSDAAVMLCRLLKVEPLPKNEIPAPPDPYYQIRQKLAALQKRFPSGKYWNHRSAGITDGRESWETVTNTPCNHAANGIYYCNTYYGVSSVPVIGDTCSWQCLGFASMLSDQLFGKNAPVRTFRDFDQLQIGDQIRLLSAEHSMVVIEKSRDSIAVAEVNADYSSCRISWGRRLSRRELENSGGALYITRYPK